MELIKFETESLEVGIMVVSILLEMEGAEKQHPVWPTSMVERAAIISEEAGEVIREANNLREGKGDIEALKYEIIQTAAMCIRMLKSISQDEQKEAQILKFNNQYV